LPNWLLISIRIYSGTARFPCDSMAFLFTLKACKFVCGLSDVLIKLWMMMLYK